MLRAPLRLLLAGILLAGLAGCGAIRMIGRGGAGRLAGQGDTRVLRQPVRPIRGTTRLLVVALDGVGANDLGRAIREGRMPHLAALLGPTRDAAGLFAHGYSVPDVAAVFPTSTQVAWASVFTGAPPAETGIVGNEWWDRQSGEFWAPTPGSGSGPAHAVAALTDGLVGRLLRAPTLYTRAGVRSHVSFSPIHGGADLLTTPDFGDLADLLGGVVEQVLQGGSAERAAYREMDEEAVEAVRDAVRRHGLPDIQTLYFPGIDLVTHYAPEPLERQQRYLSETIDPKLGEVLALYRERGALERTWVVVVADHGHTPVLADDRHSLGTEGDDEPPAVLVRSGFRVRPPRLGASQPGADFQAVLAYQGFPAYVYLADRSTCEQPGQRCDWTRPPRFREDVLTAVRAFDAANRTGERVPEMRGTLDLILARLPGPPGAPPGPFGVWDGERIVAVEAYLRAHPRPDLLRFAERLRQLGVGPHAGRVGDVILLARSGTHRPIGDRFYFGPPNRSTHGSAHPEDSRVPLLVARAGAAGDALRERVRRVVGPDATQLDVLPLLLDLLRAP